MSDFKQQEKLLRDISVIDAELLWYNTTNNRRDKIQREQQAGEAKQAALLQPIANKKADIRRQQGNVKKLSKQLHCWFNFKYWFDVKEQRIRKKRRQERDRLDKIKVALDKLLSQQSIAKQKAIDAKKDLLRLQKIDKPRLQVKRAALQKKLDTLQQASTPLPPSHRQGSGPSSPLSDKLSADIKQYQKELTILKRELQRAEQYEQQLNAATNSYERKLVHDKCEREFNESSPERVIRIKRNAQSHLEHSITKLEERLQRERESKAKIASYTHLVIDGNNLCYDGSSNAFIGLDLLLALTRQLLSRYAVMVVFDATIMHRVDQNRREITDRFTALGADIHIVQKGTSADTIITRLAREPQVGVLSNDNYVDYSHEPVVREQRLIKHEILSPRHALIEGLNLDITL